jgi:hypothetical protein
MNESWIGRYWMPLLGIVLLGVMVILLVLGALRLGALRHYDFVDRCRASGGVPRQENCRTTYINQCTTVFVGASAQTSCFSVPIRYCDDVCAGGIAESP